MDAETIAAAIKQFIINLNLNTQKCVGQGYDGCATMAGKDGGVQKIMKSTFPKALYFHCSSHKLNLVVNDLNIVPEVRNCVGTIKDIINFFRSSTLRRDYAPKIPMLCETRWSQKYKSISFFKMHFEGIINGLQQLSQEGNLKTRKDAYQLLSAATQTSFILALCIIDKYNKILERVANILQSKGLDIIKCADHIKNIVRTIKQHRTCIEEECNQLFDSATELARSLDIEFQLPRLVPSQKHRSNHPASSLEEYFRRSLYVPYLDSLINSLESRFCEDNSPAFNLMVLHPAQFLKMYTKDFKQHIEKISKFYSLDLKEGIELWRSLWENKKEIDIELTELLDESEKFYPNINKALNILLSLPYTTATIERSFSTLRRIKTWLRSTMEEDRLNGLAILSIHRNLVLAKSNFIDSELARFAEDAMKLCFQ